MSLGLTDILSIIVIFQLLFACFYLLTKGRKRLSNLLLSGLFLSLALNLTDGYLTLQGFFYQYPDWAFIGNSFGFLYGPLLYFYTLSVLKKNYHLPKTFLLHLLPFALLVLLAVFSYHLQSEEMQRSILERRNDLDFPWLVYLITGLGHVQVITYLLLSFYQLRSGKKKQKVTTRIDSVRFTLFAFSAIILLSLLASVVAISENVALYRLMLLTIIGLIFLYINRVLLKSLPDPGKSVEQVNAEKYAGSRLTEADRQLYLQKLRQHMREKKPFLDAELSLEQLAEQLDASPRHLSQLINESLKQHFFDFVNSYRIAEARRILETTDDPKTTVLEIMYQCGFNSKSSFNTLFKKNTGLTPSQYRRQHKNKLPH